MMFWPLLYGGREAKEPGWGTSPLARAVFQDPMHGGCRCVILTCHPQGDNFLKAWVCFSPMKLRSAAHKKVSYQEREASGLAFQASVLFPPWLPDIE